MREKIYLGIASLTIVIQFKRSAESSKEFDSFINLILEKYKGFILKTPEKTDHIIEIVETESYEVYFKLDTKKEYILLTHYQTNRKTITFSHISPLQLQLIIRDVCQKLLSSHSGMILHTSAVLIKDKAYLFMGKSGAGKSTIMKLLGSKFLPLTDDTGIIRKIGKNYYFFQTPFQEKNSGFRKDSQKYSLGKIFFIKKANYYRIEKIKNTFVVEKMLKQLFTEHIHSSQQIKDVLKFIPSFREFFNLYFALGENQKLLDMFKAQ